MTVEVENIDGIIDTPLKKGKDEDNPDKKVWIPSLLDTVRQKFSNVTDVGKDRRKKAEKGQKSPLLQGKTRKAQERLSIVDCLMSGLALFSLKCSSLLQFEDRRNEEAIAHNLDTLYQINTVPCDTYLRERLDEVNFRELRKAFTAIFAIIQKNKKLESYRYLDEGFICSLDGTGYFSSDKIHCNNCCEKKSSKGGPTKYYHQVCQAAIVHPDMNIVIPFCPEPILKEGGMDKNDCELNATKRFLADLEREHPHLKVVITQDAIGANGPNILAIKSHKNRSFIIVAKEGSNKSLFEFNTGIKLENYEFISDGIQYSFKYINKVSLNNTYPDLFVNYFECVQTDLKTGVQKSCAWITDIKIKPRNIFKLMRAGRAKWKIENETFNTLKNQGYNFEHNFGHGNKNLSTVFATLMMLAFLIDQAQELLCTYFQQALDKAGRKVRLWEKMIELFKSFYIHSWQDFYLSIARGHRKRALTPNTS